MVSKICIKINNKTLSLFNHEQVRKFEVEDDISKYHLISFENYCRNSSGVDYLPEHRWPAPGTPYTKKNTEK